MSYKGVVDIPDFCPPHPVSGPFDPLEAFVMPQHAKKFLRHPAAVAVVLQCFPKTLKSTPLQKEGMVELTSHLAEYEPIPQVQATTAAGLGMPQLTGDPSPIA